MTKKIVVLTLLILMAFQGSAFAQTGQVILEDVIYGSIIGGILGGAWYLLDDDEFGHKLGTGVALGAIAGFVLGVSDVRSVVEIDKDDVKVAMPTVIIEKKGSETVYSTNLLKVNF